MTDNPTIALALHGGAGARLGVDYTPANDHLSNLAARGRDMLGAGASALDVVEQMIIAMEQSGLYTAGRGSPPNKAGYAELDASIMEGAQTNTDDNPFVRRAGAVAAVAHLKSPIKAARAVMETTPHVMLAGRGAENFCRAQGFDFVGDPNTYYKIPIGISKDDINSEEIRHGTVGAAALDLSGRLAAGTSTGGVFGKLEGRVGDTPLIGAGTWADETVAASCTGLGEMFIKAGGAQDVASRVRYQGASLQEATDALINDVARLGGDGGVIAVSRTGEIAFSFNSAGMKRAGVSAKTALFSATF